MIFAQATSSESGSKVSYQEIYITAFTQLEPNTPPLLPPHLYLRAYEDPNS